MSGNGWSLFVISERWVTLLLLSVSEFDMLENLINMHDVFDGR